MDARAALAMFLLGLASGCGSVAAKPDASMGDTPSEGPVGRTIRSHSEKFLVCARDAVTVQTGTTQQIQLKFQIDPTGKVEKATVASMSAPDPDLQSCVLRALKKLSFPPPKDRKSKVLTYPLSLKPE